MKFEKKPEKPQEKIELMPPSEEELDTQLDAVIDNVAILVEEGKMTREEAQNLHTSLELIKRMSGEQERIRQKNVELHQWREIIRGRENEEKE